MEQLLKAFKDCYIREYKNGFEIRTKNLDWELEKAHKMIKVLNLNVEIFEKDHRVKSFSIREKGQ